MLEVKLWSVFCVSKCVVTIINAHIDIKLICMSMILLRSSRLTV